MSSARKFLRQTSKSQFCRLTRIGQPDCTVRPSRRFPSNASRNKLPARSSSSKPFVVRVATVKCQNRPPRKLHLSRHTYHMLFALRDHREGRQIAIVVQQQMKFRRSLGQAELQTSWRRDRSPWHPSSAGDLETELPLLSGFWLAGHQDLALRQQLLKHGAMQPPRPMLIGVGQGGARRSRGQPQMTKFPFAGSQSSTNFAQRLGVPQLTEEHGDELAPAGETSSMTLRVALAHG